MPQRLSKNIRNAGIALVIFSFVSFGCAIWVNSITESNQVKQYSREQAPLCPYTNTVNLNADFPSIVVDLQNNCWFGGINSTKGVNFKILSRNVSSFYVKTRDGSIHEIGNYNMVLSDETPFYLLGGGKVAVYIETTGKK